MNLKRTAAECAAMIGIAAALAAAGNLVRSESTRLSWTRSPVFSRLSAPSPADVAPPRDPGAIFTAIHGDTAEKLHQAGALFVDARRTAAYAEGHIEGARSIPVWESDVDARIAALAREMPGFERPIVLYCSGPTCHDSEMLAEKLALAGFYNLYVYTAGYPGWTQRGGAVRSGSAP